MQFGAGRNHGFCFSHLSLGLPTSHPGGEPEEAWHSGERSTLEADLRVHVLEMDVGWMREMACEDGKGAQRPRQGRVEENEEKWSSEREGIAARGEVGAIRECIIPE